MKFSSLNQFAQESINEIVQAFKIHELIDLDKAEMGNRVSELVDLIGQDGQQFVHHIYTERIKTNPLAENYPEHWLLCSFLATTFKGILRKNGYDEIDSVNREELLELAVDIMEKIQNDNA